VVIPF